MRHYLVLLLGSFALLLATACSRPAPPALQPAPAEYCYQQRRCAPVEDAASAPTLQQVRISHVATPTSGGEVPRPRFYTRWRRVHGRWYHFTYRL
ncbi:hypothetical protein ACFPAF_17095 [Hymenobacter endophyticus]|uniref:Lipoprotein n=1 Tax=Hymenobacter endophyticus TaxID=3076335 RepID=A0ABU3TL64_9BACT|nr:hypothetical protein [Hymenobacter endophyticus]MDU0372122.1 hypothetical protein [Hymenobacter endophyticus]